MENMQLESRVKQLEGRTRSLTVLCGLLLLSLTAVTLSTIPSRVKAAEDANVLHVKGLIVEDDQGRARILLGAPFPKTSDRLRQDDPSAAMVFLDKQGHDRFLVGETIAAQIDGKVPQQFHRMGQSASYGATILDPAGNERGGIGFLSNGTTVNRAVMALDRPGEDAIGMMVDDKTGYAGLGVEYAPEVGKWTTGLILGTQGNKAFITIKDLNDMPRATFGIGPQPVPSLQLFDSKGNPGPELLKTDNAAK
jgi:hypothetical protein